MRAQAGDVVLFHHPTWNLFTWLIHFTTRSIWNHAAIVVGVDAADATIIAEATASGVRESRLRDTKDSVCVIPVKFDDEEDQLTAVAWAVARVGTRYGYFNAFMCGVNNVLVGLHLVIKRTDAIICSELVAEALERAGFDFGKDSSQMSPGDLATFFGIER
jgi:uncharacterized protein YycO